MAFKLVFLSRIESGTIIDGNEPVALCREAEQMFPAWSTMAGFYGLAVVNSKTGEVIHLVR